MPNAGKSTLLGVLTAAKPKVADYPFTTLVPNLGVCEIDYRTTVFADVPGLLEGAHEGHGLGHEFLRHVTRCRALVHVVDGSSPDPVGDFRAIQLELELFNPALLEKPQVWGVVCVSVGWACACVVPPLTDTHTLSRSFALTPQTPPTPRPDTHAPPTHPHTKPPLV